MVYTVRSRIARIYREILSQTKKNQKFKKQISLSLLLNAKKNFEKKLTKFNTILVKNYLRVIGKLTGETLF